ncbi:protein dbl-1 [Leptopilina boulardi]|uniref:protein dbl-1 n=1 Tax=Leptopilina boulardi TaxID=63433 RepID=UPI0021F54713|nr:protein dbl-1 [Leptopilina boulardi]
MGKHLITHLESRDTDKKFRVGSIDGYRAIKQQKRWLKNQQNKRGGNFLVSDKKLIQQSRVKTKSIFIINLLFLTWMCSTIVTGVPMPKQTKKISNYDQTFEMINVNSFDFEDEEDNDILEQRSNVKRRLEEEDLETIRSSIVEGLGLQRIPDPTKANISQTEYERAHRDYLTRIQTSGHERRKRLFTFYPSEHSGNGSCCGGLLDDRPLESLTFHLNIPDRIHSTVDHSTLRFLLSSQYNQIQSLNILIYESLQSGAARRLISKRKLLNQNQPQASQWIEFDLTDAVLSTLNEENHHLILQLEFQQQNGIPIEYIIFSPVLNIFTTTYNSRTIRNKRGAHDQLISLHKGRRTECRGDNKKCCRHQMTVIFKDLKGFEFIIQPKTFDAGYCKGRCPPRYNPAHHHALLQSLIWKEDRRKAPRPCCAPSKLAELEILYFDENDPTKLKISNWKNMKVLECACS